MSESDEAPSTAAVPSHASTGAAPPVGKPLVIAQRAQLSSFLGLSLKNGLLNLITLTLYRFWGRTKVRRRVWSSTYLNDEAFEYTGRGKELFFGFLIATFGIGIPFLILVGVAQFLGPIGSALVILPLYIGLIFLFGFGVFTAFRYLASRTVWRGVRFSLTGSAQSYGFTYLGYTLLSGVTLGWFWPAASRRLSGELWGKLKFGDLAFSFDLEAARKEKVYPAYAMGWAFVFVGYIVLIASTFSLMGVLSPNEDGTVPPEAMGAFFTLYAGILVYILLVIVAFAPYRAAALRSVAAGIRVGEAKFRLNVGWADMAGLYLVNILLVTISLGFLMPFVQARTAKFLFNRLTSDGLVDLDRVVQSGDKGPQTAEGLADAFGASLI